MWVGGFKKRANFAYVIKVWPLRLFFPKLCVYTPKHVTRYVLKQNVYICEVYMIKSCGYPIQRKKSHIFQKVSNSTSEPAIILQSMQVLFIYKINVYFCEVYTLEWMGSKRNVLT